MNLLSDTNSSHSWQKLGCILFRFILGAVSPAVVVPSMLNLQIAGYGTKEGIPTLVMAASSCDDVLAISLFSVFLGIAFSQGDWQFCNVFIPGCIIYVMCIYIILFLNHAQYF